MSLHLDDALARKHTAVSNKEGTMKRFVIKQRPGRTTVVLTGQKYFSKTEAAAAGRERGTQPIYLGSFSSRLDPRRLLGVERIGPDDVGHGVTVKPVVLDDGPFELRAADIQEIREWLMVNGSWALTQKTMQQYQADQDRLKAEERAHLEVQLRAELSAELRPQLQAELAKDIEANRAHPLIEAVRAVEAAGAAVREEAARLVSAGHRLTTRRGRVAGGAPASQLLEMTLALRGKAFAGFEEACKAAGLMAGRTATPGMRKGAKPR